MRLHKAQPIKYSASEGDTSMRPTLRLLSSAVLCVFLVAPLSAQQVPDFTGQWQRTDSNDIGSGWGDVITVTQDGSRLQVEYALFVASDRQPPLRFVYDLEGRETRNGFMMGRGVQMQISRAKLIGGSLEITTSHELVVQGRAMQSEVRQVLSLESPATLIVEVTRLGVLGGPPTTSRSVYRRVAGA
jgi:hypothetical protein